LRFPQFTEEWTEYKLEDITSFSKDRISSSILTEENYVSTENMLQDFQGIVRSQGVPTNTNVMAYKKGDVLISNIRPYLKKVWKSDRDGGCSADVFVIRANKTVCNEDFLHYIIANDCFIAYVMSGVKGVKMPRGDKEQMKGYRTAIPSLEEQTKIARLLTAIDERITSQNRIIKELQSLISGITHKISKHSTVRRTMLKELLYERHEKNSLLFPVHSVSVSEGIVNQIEYLGRSFSAADTSNYNVAHKGDIIYTKSPTGDFPFGIVKRSAIETNVAVSPLYGVYQPVSDEVAVYLHYYFCSPLNAQNYLHKLIQKGAKNTINITNQRFLENYVPLPDKDTLSKFVLLMNVVSEKLNSEKSLLNALRSQKSYLLKEMFV
jgi:type I restriction enzyme S subunit